jgi:hypothetical protein
MLGLQMEIHISTSVSCRSKRFIAQGISNPRPFLKYIEALGGEKSNPVSIPADAYTRSTWYELGTVLVQRMFAIRNQDYP